MLEGSETSGVTASLPAEPFFAAARRALHRAMVDPVSGILFVSKDGVPSMADEDSPTSLKLAARLCELIPDVPTRPRLKAQTSGKTFENLIAQNLRESFARLSHLRPGSWSISNSGSQSIALFRQYEHLDDIQDALEANPALQAHLGQGYLIKADVTVGRASVSDAEINQPELLVGPPPGAADNADIRAAINPLPILHASVSCKWTIRSDRAQNARSEALNLLRHRKGHSPHIVVVTGDPLPARIGALALGTGDIDCVYHFALDELVQAASDVGAGDALETLKILIEGRRLKDISNLALDLAV